MKNCHSFQLYSGAFVRIQQLSIMSRRLIFTTWFVSNRLLSSLSYIFLPNTHHMKSDSQKHSTRLSCSQRCLLPTTVPTTKTFMKISTCFSKNFPLPFTLPLLFFPMLHFLPETDPDELAQSYELEFAKTRWEERKFILCFQSSARQPLASFLLHYTPLPAYRPCTLYFSSYIFD